MMVQWTLVPVSLLVAASLVSGQSYTNGWAAECPGGELEARGVARDTGCGMDEGEVIPGREGGGLSSPLGGQMRLYWSPVLAQWRV